MNTSTWLNPCRCVWLCLGLGLYGPAWSQEDLDASPEVVPLRGWVDTTGGLPNPYLCGALAVGGSWSVEGCGSGGGFLQNTTAVSPNDGQEMAHFRLRRTLEVWREGAQRLFLLPAVGIAEVQRGQDQAGFKFEGDSAEAAGAEASLSLRWVSQDPALPVRAQVDVGGAWVPDIGGVIQDASPWVPFTMFDFGIDF